MSFPSIAKIFNRDYATVRSSYELMIKKYESDHAFKVEVDELIRTITY